MGLFFNKKEKTKSTTNNYLEDQKALFDTKGEQKQAQQEDSYDLYIMKPKDYSNVPKYKAFDEKKVEVVIDKDEFGYQNLNPEIETVAFERKNLYEDLSDTVNNQPIETENEKNTSIYDDNLVKEIKNDEEIEVIEVDNNSSIVQPKIL